MTHDQNEKFGFRLWLFLIGMALLFTVATCAKGATAADCDFRLYASLGGGQGAFGSGTAISPRCIVTAAHVVDHKHLKNITCMSPDGTQYVGDCVAVAPASKGDVALIALRTNLRAYAPLASGDPVKGAEITAVGYGHDGVLRQGTGLVSYYTTDHELAGTRSVQSGDSGGGLFNAAGELCGVIVACDDSEKTAEYHAGKLHAEPVSKVQWLIQAYQTQCPNGQCPLTPPDPSGYTGPLVPVQPRQVAPQYAQPQYFVYPSPAPQAAPAPIPAPIVQTPPDLSPLQAAIKQTESNLGAKIDSLGMQAKNILGAQSDAQTQTQGLQGTLADKIKSVESNLQGAIDSKVTPALGKLGMDLAGAKSKLDAFNATPGGEVAQEVAKGLLAAGVTAVSGGAGGLPAWLTAIFGGVAGVGGGGFLLALALKLLGVIGTAAANPPIDPIALATQIGTQIQSQLAGNTSPQATSIAALLAKEAAVWQTISGVMGGFNSGIAGAANPTPSATPTATG